MMAGGHSSRTGKKKMIATILTGLVAALHLYFMYLEMIAWNTPRGHRAFKLTPEFASASKVLAANQGLYNGFLAAGLFWGLWLGAGGFAVKIFFLVCVVVGRPVWRGNRQPQNTLCAGTAGGGRAGGPFRWLVKRASARSA